MVVTQRKAGGVRLRSVLLFPVMFGPRVETIRQKSNNMFQRKSLQDQKTVDTTTDITDIEINK